MDVLKRIEKALLKTVGAEYVRLTDDGGITGFAVSPWFIGKSMVERQAAIDESLRSADPPLTRDELRRVLIIAAISPLEYDSVGARIRISKVRDFADQKMVDIELHGTVSDAEYVETLLSKLKGAKISEVPQSSGKEGTPTRKLRVQGQDKSAVSKRQVLNLLGSDPYIEVLAKA